MLKKEVCSYEFGSGKKSVCILGSSRGNEVQQFYCRPQLIRKFRPIANIPDPYEDDILETRHAPLPTATFFVHNEPPAYADTAVIRLIEKQRQYRQSPEHDIHMISQARIKNCNSILPKNMI